MVADRRGHGESQHDQGCVAMPAVPGAGLVVVEAELVFGGLEAVLDGQAVTFHLDQGVEAGVLSAQNNGGELRPAAARVFGQQPCLIQKNTRETRRPGT